MVGVQVGSGSLAGVAWVLFRSKSKRDLFQGEADTMRMTKI